jgi:hypothetical protein
MDVIKKLAKVGRKTVQTIVQKIDPKIYKKIALKLTQKCSHFVQIFSARWRDNDPFFFDKFHIL